MHIISKISWTVNHFEVHFALTPMSNLDVSICPFIFVVYIPLTILGVFAICFALNGRASLLHELVSIGWMFGGERKKERKASSNPDAGFRRHNIHWAVANGVSAITAIPSSGVQNITHSLILYIEGVKSSYNSYSLLSDLLILLKSY